MQWGEDHEDDAAPAAVEQAPAVEQDPAYHFTWRGIAFEWKQGQGFCNVLHAGPRCAVTARGRQWSAAIYLLGTTHYGQSSTPEAALEKALAVVAAFASKQLRGCGLCADDRTR